MPKFLYCMVCMRGFKLEMKKPNKCSCGNLMGKYRSDGTIAEICAKNPAKSRFIGIPNGNNPKFEYQKDEFLAIRDNNTWNEWERGHLIHTMGEWEERISKRHDYCIGTVDSLKKSNWHHRWVYCECICLDE